MFRAARYAMHAARRVARAGTHSRIVRYVVDRPRIDAPACICTLDILIHSLIHTDYIIGLYRGADRGSGLAPRRIAFNDPI